MGTVNQTLQFYCYNSFNGLRLSRFQKLNSFFPNKYRACEHSVDECQLLIINGDSDNEL